MSITIEQLRECRALMREIEIIEKQMRRLEGMRHTSGDIVLGAGSAGYDPQHTKMWQQLDHLEKVYRIKVLRYGQVVCEIEAAIESLPVSFQSVLRLRYVVGLRWDEVAKRLNYSKIWCFKQRASALQALGLEDDTEDDV